ncbi:MAG: hypothetical protein ABI678_33115 [Kofleriaceae bacterium]
METNVGQLAQVPTFASYCPEAALEEFDQAQRREPQYALRRIRAGVETVGSTFGISRWFGIETLTDAIPEIEERYDLGPALELVLAELRLDDPDLHQLGV